MRARGRVHLHAKSVLVGVHRSYNLGRARAGGPASPERPAQHPRRHAASRAAPGPSPAPAGPGIAAPRATPPSMPTPCPTGQHTACAAAVAGCAGNCRRSRTARAPRVSPRPPRRRLRPAAGSACFCCRRTWPVPLHTGPQATARKPRRARRGVRCIRLAAVAQVGGGGGWERARAESAACRAAAGQTAFNLCSSAGRPRRGGSVAVGRRSTPRGRGNTGRGGV
jgi:hypothetical protein